MKPLPEEFAGFDPALLKALHILTREGALNQDSRRKLKQVRHLLQFITPLLDERLAALSKTQANRKPVLVDHGAGKSYLGFMLWNQWFEKHGGEIFGIEVREDLVARSRELAQQFGFRGMRFLSLLTQNASEHPELAPQIDIVTALHACDTATDDAISFGLKRQAQHIVVVPCCQAEVASALRLAKGQAVHKSPLSELWRHPLHTREFGAQITNVLRCLRLEASGYQVRVTELVGWEHSMKNELIIASKHPDVARNKPKERLGFLLAELGLSSLDSRFSVAAFSKN